MLQSEHNGSNGDSLSISDLYTQNWEHVRHVENERLNFTSFYFVILAAMIAYISQAQPTKTFTIILLGLMTIMSIIGALMSFRLKADMEAHGNCLRSLVETSPYKRFFTFGAETGWTTHIKIRTLFPIIYSIFVVCFIVSIIFVLFPLNPISSQIIPTQNCCIPQLTMTVVP